jgi:hypothetical protein
MDIPPKVNHPSEHCWICGRFCGWIGYMQGYVCRPCEVMWGHINTNPARMPPPKDAIR